MGAPSGVNAKSILGSRLMITADGRLWADGKYLSTPADFYGLGVPVLYVHSGTGDSGFLGETPDAPCATLDQAVNNATASTNAIIVVMPGHAETISGAAGAAIDKIGLTIVCLGEGARKPTFSFSATDSTITMSAASCQILGYPIFIATIDSVVSGLVISAANCRADIEFRDTSASVEFVRGVLTTAAADHLVLNVIHKGFAGGNAGVNVVRLVGSDNVKVNIDAYGIFSTAAVEFLTTACLNVEVTGSVYNIGSTDQSKLVVDTVTGSDWSAVLWDAAAGAKVSGGDGAALAVDDVSAVTADTEAILTDAEAILADTAAGVPQIAEELVTFATATAASRDIFTVSGGMVAVKFAAHVETTLDGEEANGILDIGTEDAPTIFADEATVDETALQAGDVIGAAGEAPGQTAAALLQGDFAITSENIEATWDETIDTGALDCVAIWFPLTSGATLVPSEA